VVGCGAAAKELCLPMLTRFPGAADSLIAVDVHREQAVAVASEFGIQHSAADYRQLPFEIDAAVITTPHYLHAEQAIHFLQQGKSVFVEKPLGLSQDEVVQMLRAAAATGATLMVNNCRRLFPAYQAVRQMIQAETLGRVRHIKIADGSPFEWNSVSAFYIRDARRARGVLLDRGAHTVDLICWWLAGAPQVVEARSDAHGGAEAVMELELTCGNADVHLQFSRLFRLANTYSVECDEGRIVGRLFNASEFEIQRSKGRETVRAGRPQTYNEYSWQLVRNFVEVVQGLSQPHFTAADVAPSIAVIEEAYRRAQPFEQPWYTRDANVAGLRRLAMESHS
jgi:predicted dehydrogenase